MTLNLALARLALECSHALSKFAVGLLEDSDQPDVRSIELKRPFLNPTTSKAGDLMARLDRFERERKAEATSPPPPPETEFVGQALEVGGPQFPGVTGVDLPTPRPPKDPEG